MKHSRCYDMCHVYKYTGEFRIEMAGEMVYRWLISAYYFCLQFQLRLSKDRAKPSPPAVVCKQDARRYAHLSILSFTALRPRSPWTHRQEGLVLDIPYPSEDSPVTARQEGRTCGCQ